MIWRVLFVYSFCWVEVCLSLDCLKDCAVPDYTNQNYKPQECARLCGEIKPLASRLDDLNGLKLKVDQLASITTASLVLLIIILVCLVICFAKYVHSKHIISSWKKKKANPQVKMDLNKETVIQMTADPCSEVPPVNSQAKVPIVRTKSPSESTCPDDGETVEVNGYDNLALSRSTISTHTPPSPPSSPATPGTGDCDASVFNTTTTSVHFESSP